MQDYVEIAKRIELQEEMLLDYEYPRILKREFYV